MMGEARKKGEPDDPASVDDQHGGRFDSDTQDIWYSRTAQHRAVGSQGPSFMIWLVKVTYDMLPMSDGVRGTTGRTKKQRWRAGQGNNPSV